jgi:hypothetical protein
MAEPVLERDLQELEDLRHKVEAGDEEARQTYFFLVSGIARNMTRWQQIIHGPTGEFRQRAIRWLCVAGKLRLARRFAMCGRGDLGCTGDKEGAVRVRPKGCGARYCPRCSRRFGRRFLTRVASHLSSSPHGALWHTVLTQRVIKTESLKEARKRFDGAWGSYYRRMRREGMKACLATYHVTPSLNGGWHYHCHLIVEWSNIEADEALRERLNEAWWKATGEDSERGHPIFFREVAGPGPALDGLANDRQMDFWAEAPNPVEVVLQYCLRDVLQGAEGWIQKLDSDWATADFCEALTGAKLHRLYGTWRKKLVVEAEAETMPSADAATAVKPVVKPVEGQVVWTVVGSMDDVGWRAKQGEVACRELLLRLRGRSSNRGAVACRLSQWVTECVG